MIRHVDNVAATADMVSLGLGDGDHARLGYHGIAGLNLPVTKTVALLMRRPLYPTPGRWEYVGMAEVDTGQVANWSAYGHDTSMGYQYSAARCYPNGFVGPFARPLRLDFDATGALITPPLPAWPRDVSADPIAAGKFTVGWLYESLGQGAFPTDFQVFEGATAATIDYGTPLVDSVTGLNHTVFVANESSYAFTTAAFADLSKHAFGVRGRNTGGALELNTFASDVMVARATAPNAGTIDAISQRETR